MSNWFRPVERVDDVVVVGEEHRERSSRQLLFEVWDELDGPVDAVCVEVHPGEGYKTDRGGAVGGSLVRAEELGIPRYYVDSLLKDLIKAFGGRCRAYSYLRGLEDRVPTHEEGLADRDVCREVRAEVRDEYGEEAFELVFEKRERGMAGRAKWVASQVEGVVLLVVGSGHFEPIVSLLENDCDELEVEDRRKRTGGRFAAGLGPWGTMIAVIARDLKRVLGPKVDGLREDYGNGELL